MDDVVDARDDEPLDLFVFAASDAECGICHCHKDPVYYLTLKMYLDCNETVLCPVQR